MDEKVKEIVCAVPDGLYQYQMPDISCDEQWIHATPDEKGFLLIRELIENELYEEHRRKKKRTKNPNSKILNLGQGPTFGMALE